MFTTFHKKVALSDEAISLPLKVFSDEVLEAIARYSTHYNLVNTGYVEVDANEYYLFIYIKDVGGEYHRIDFEL